MKSFQKNRGLATSMEAFAFTRKAPAKQDKVAGRSIPDLLPIRRLVSPAVSRLVKTSGLFQARAFDEHCVFGMVSESSAPA